MGKLTISTGPFSIAMLNYQRVSDFHQHLSSSRWKKTQMLEAFYEASQILSDFLKVVFFLFGHLHPFSVLEGHGGRGDRGDHGALQGSQEDHGHVETLELLRR